MVSSGLFPLRYHRLGFQAMTSAGRNGQDALKSSEKTALAWRPACFSWLTVCCVHITHTGMCLLPAKCWTGVSGWVMEISICLTAEVALLSLPGIQSLGCIFWS